ncbi:MAG: glucuronosyltransferase [Bacteroidetes bacterium]|nr:glucuronosyltransferase [Bacteroidota bacterium]
MPKAVLITSHFLNSRRKAGFHNIAASLLEKGYTVLFLTGNASYIHHLKSDYRASLINRTPLNKLLKENNDLYQFIRFTVLHPVNFRSDFLNKLFLPSVKKYSDALKGFKEPEDFIKDSDLFIFESFPGLLWFEYFKSLNGKAKYVYRVSDDLRQLRKHPYIIEHEEKISSEFDLISVPSEYIYNVLKGRGNVKLHNHGISREIFDRSETDPYKKNGSFKSVFTGNAYLDYNFLDIVSANFPGDEFHILGPFKDKLKKNNIIFHGEMDFRDTVPFIKSADAGLHSLIYTGGAESFSDSLKIIQYTYCRLPVIAPDFIKSGRNNFKYYRSGDEDSIVKAVRAAKDYDRSGTDISGICDWGELTDKLIKE